MTRWINVRRRIHPKTTHDNTKRKLWLLHCCSHVIRKTVTLTLNHATWCKCCPIVHAPTSGLDGVPRSVNACTCTCSLHGQLLLTSDKTKALLPHCRPCPMHFSANRLPSRRRNFWPCLIVNDWLIKSLSPQTGLFNCRSPTMQLNDVGVPVGHVSCSSSTLLPNYH